MGTIRSRFGRVAATALTVAALGGGLVALPSPAGAATGSADVGVALSRTPNLASGGDVVTYTATITNSGPDTATGVVLLDPLGSFGRVKGTVTSTAGTCSDGSSDYTAIVSCSLGDIAAAGSVTVTIPVQILRSGIVESTVAIGSTSDDPNGANDHASVSLVVQPGPTYQERLANGYFTLLVGRAPTAGELSAWAQRFSTQPMQQNIAGIASTNTARSRWVDEQFRRYLGRPAGSSAATFVKLLNQGKSYDDVTALLVSSAEFAKSVTSYCDDTVCVDFDATAWLAKAYKAVTGDAMPRALQQQYFDAYGGERSFAVAAKMIKSVHGRRKFVDVTVRKWQHRPAGNFDLYVNVSDLLKGARPELVEATILASYNVYGPWVDGCCSYYPYPVYDSHPTPATASTEATR